MMQEKATPFYLRAIEIMPNFAAARCNLGTCYRYEGRTEEAIVQNQLALQANPLMVDPYTNLGNILKDLGRLDEAIVYYKKAIDLDPSNHIHYSNLGVRFSSLLSNSRML